MASNLIEAIEDYKITTASDDIPLETMKDLIERKEQLKETLVSISKSQVPQLKESDINPFQTMNVENLLSFDPNFADQAPNLLQDLLEEVASKMPVDANTSNEASEHPTAGPYQEPQLDQVLADLIYAIDDKINLSEDDSTHTGRDSLLQKRDKLQQKLDSLVKDNESSPVDTDTIPSYGVEMLSQEDIDNNPYREMEVEDLINADPMLAESSEQTTPREISIVNNDNIKSIAKLPRY